MTWASHRRESGEDEGEGAQGGGVEDRSSGGHPEGGEPEGERDGGDEDGGGGEHDPGQHRDVACDPAREDRLESPRLLFTPGHLGDEADPEQREEEGSEEAELVRDDPAETVDPLDPAVDRDEGVTGGDRLGVGVDLLWRGVDAGDRPRCADHAGDEHEHEHQRRAAVRPPLDAEHGPQAGRRHRRASAGAPSSLASRGPASSGMASPS